MTRAEWISGIYQDMTGELPPESFWETPSGREIVENNPAWLYDQPTANLYQIINELPPETRTDLICRISERTRNVRESEDELLRDAIRTAADRFFLSNRPFSAKRENRYRKPAGTELKEAYRKLLWSMEREDVFFFSVVLKGVPRRPETNLRARLSSCQDSEAVGRLTDMLSAKQDASVLDWRRNAVRRLEKILKKGQ